MIACNELAAHPGNVHDDEAMKTLSLRRENEKIGSDCMLNLDYKCPDIAR